MRREDGGRGRARALPAGVAVMALGAALLVGFGDRTFGSQANEPAEAAEPAGRAQQPAEPEQLRVEVIETTPHDEEAFTQGLEISGGVLYEGTGLTGGSSVSATDMASGERLARVALPDEYFGEGITLTEDALWQITWQDGVAFERDPATLEARRTVEYEGEGWGLCHQEQRDRLVMSDGSGVLTFRDPETFEETGSVEVRSGGEVVSSLNELECVDGEVYANIWMTDRIVRIDPETGAVTAEIDASGLLTADEEETADVLNGIAKAPECEEFLITGKLWPHMFRVRFVPA
ncbi:glutaminyl-peptide cyclotransferase [Streptomyces sp. 6N223]|uniref:glutaminyl-peptide cyclotransferase n=1 Tax=Streptomyces sp. 6N223 TaxID=3457412 RepID=UPI003FD18940